MKEFWNAVQFVFTAVGGWLGYFLGGCDGLLYALLAFVVIDYITGVMCAINDKALSSDRVVVSITFHQVDYAPDTKAGTDCNDQCLKDIDCTAKKSHNQMCEQTLFLMVCKRLALLLSLLFRPFFTCFICKAILSLSSLFSPFFLLLDFFLEKT